jgi:hypothetical protein
MPCAAEARGKRSAQQQHKRSGTAATSPELCARREGEAQAAQQQNNTAGAADMLQMMHLHEAHMQLQLAVA